MTRLLLLALVLSTPALAQHAGHATASARTDAPATREFRAANDRMHRDMAIRYTGNPDLDFAASMIPHHQGAIEMARVQLRYGTDPEMRRIAEEIIRAQEAEIAELRAFLARTAPPR
ncbi:CopM family metallochaperone [Falsiroseomonas sp. HW251]|uniref:CopM family metallochaperone n=1 Tax=Falsiroseomonas sp. HW251 TaxID=3390998 RepID=UPI003D316A52